MSVRVCVSEHSQVCGKHVLSICLPSAPLARAPDVAGDVALAVLRAPLDLPGASLLSSSRLHSSAVPQELGGGVLGRTAGLKHLLRLPTANEGGVQFRCGGRPSSELCPPAEN